MASSFFGLEIAISGLNTSQAQINTVSHNVSNAETEGYSRQHVITKAGQALQSYSTAGMVGTGSVASGIDQVRSQYYDEKYWKSNSLSGQYSSINHYLESIENYFNETTENGFTTMYDNFFNALNSISNDASSLEKRTSANQLAQTFTEYMNNVYTNVQEVQRDVNVEVKNQVDKINSLSTEVAAITRQIAALEVTGDKANDLRDQRALMIDELSTMANIQVKETTVNKVGLNKGEQQYTVTINGEILIDNYDANKLKCVPRTKLDNQNDIDGLYDVVWTKTGEDLNLSGNYAKGSLASLIQVRDGNNGENLKGNVTASTGDKKITLNDASINDLSKLNIPQQGYITIGDTDYGYTDYTVKVSGSGENTTYEYTFNLSDAIVKDYSGKAAQVGESVAFKGVPHYLAQINEFLRTFSSEYNEIHNAGEDLNGNAGRDYFNYNNTTSGAMEQLTEIVNVTAFGSNTAGYHQITGKNIAVDREILNNPKLFAAGNDVDKGVENNETVKKLINLKNDETMFKQGKPSTFLSSVISELAVDKANYLKLSKNQTNIVAAIDSQRLENSSVDLDEEALNLVKFQNAYDLSAKIFSVMSEIYDRLISLGN